MTYFIIYNNFICYSHAELANATLKIKKWFRNKGYSKDLPVYFIQISSFNCQLTRTYDNCMCFSRQNWRTRPWKYRKDSESTSRRRKTARPSLARTWRTWQRWVFHFSYCPCTLVMKCGKISGIKSIWWYWISVQRDYTTLPYLTIWHAQTVFFFQKKNVLSKNMKDDGWYAKLFIHTQRGIFSISY